MSASPVRISDKLKTEIEQCIYRLYGPQIDAVNAEKPNLGDRLYDLMYGPYLEGMERLPPEFFRATETLTFGRVGGRANTVEFKLSKKRLMGWKHPKSEQFTLSDSFGDKLQINDTPETAEIIGIIHAWWDRRKAVADVRDAGAKEVKRVLNNFKSLAPAIKMFPPLVELLPSDVRRKIEVPMHRLSSAAMELNPALKQLATDIALKKLMDR